MKILFLCTGNSCRSQMAEGWARHLKKGEVEACSAGIKRHGMNPHAVRVMEEAGVDMTGHTSKTLDELPDQNFEVVVTLCGHANETCPFFPGQVRRVHRGFDDPPSLCAEMTNEDEILAVYRRVRDEIRDFVAALPQTLDADQAGTDGL
ncbi:protein tyrosine phosphatase [Desulfomicrobium apsheronum]|uniref:Protein tyrosine phosphatase n=1 Tax=Desulfomicrobium apsheronum TaxID=52560 RepID=A0A1I3R8K6_9BACT|nr:arsenate reductase ArsC [Desulfomicrobium apsheronum]SFJ41989.1 protein tyrosine phosphatase [Desulfomicrobium apsheronum]